MRKNLRLPIYRSLASPIKMAPLDLEHQEDTIKAFLDLIHKNKLIYLKMDMNPQTRTFTIKSKLKEDNSTINVTEGQYTMVFKDGTYKTATDEDLKEYIDADTAGNSVIDRAIVDTTQLII